MFSIGRGFLPAGGLACCRSSVHLPRLEQARDQARQITGDCRGPLPPLQQAALTGHLSQLDQLISQITSNDPETAQP